MARPFQEICRALLLLPDSKARIPEMEHACIVLALEQDSRRFFRSQLDVVVDMRLFIDERAADKERVVLFRVIVHDKFHVTHKRRVDARIDPVKVGIEASSA